MAVDMVSSLSTQVNSYVQWAKNAGSGKRLAGLDQAGDTNRVTNLKGLPRGAQSAAQKAAVDGFKRALTDAVGETIADQVWKDTKADKQKGLTAAMIAKIVNRANDLFQKSLTRPNGVMKHMFNMSAAEIRATVNGNNLPPDEFQHKCRVSVAVMRSNALLGMTPITREQVQTFTSQFNRVNGELAKCWAELQRRGDSQSLQRAGQLEERMAELTDKMSEVVNSAGRLPGGEASLKKLAEHWTDAVNRTCHKLSSAMPGTRQQIDRLQGELARLQADLGRDGALTGLLKANRKETGKKLQTMLNDCVKTAFGKQGLKQMIDGFKVGEMLSKVHGELLNKAEWAPISKTFTGTLGGQTLRLQSDIVSGNKICKSIFDRYESGVNAYNCHSMGTSNAVNIATSKLTVTGPDGQPRTVFSGVRHGVHSAQDITNKTDRAAANVERARQTVMAAFTTYLEAHPAEVAEKERSGEPISFNMTSVSLLSPIPLTKEKSMLADQVAAWREVSNEPLEVNVGGRTYTVRPNILAFNFGVDYFSVDLGHLGWSASDKVNSSSAVGLRNRVQAFCQHHPAGTPERKAVDTLWRQIAGTLNAGGERKAGGEAYKVPARIAVLTYLLGDVPVWNCKSGKDRTGMLDVEAKFLATLIDRGEDIPEPGAKLNREQSQLLKTIAMESGNLEMQEYNTGIAGYKLYGGQTTFDRLGGQDDKGVKKAVKGGSGYVGS